MNFPGAKADVENIEEETTNAAMSNVEQQIGGALMNNGSRDISSNDIQKLQQQLQDIKEQV